MNVKLSGPVPLPSKRTRWTLNKSPHAQKYAMRTYERIIHKRLFAVVDTPLPIAENFLQRLRPPTLGDVALRVTRFNSDSLAAVTEKKGAMLSVSAPYKNCTRLRSLLEKEVRGQTETSIAAAFEQCTKEHDGRVRWTVESPSGRTFELRLDPLLDWQTPMIMLHDKPLMPEDLMKAEEDEMLADYHAWDKEYPVPEGLTEEEVALWRGTMADLDEHYEKVRAKQGARYTPRYLLPDSAWDTKGEELDMAEVERMLAEDTMLAEALEKDKLGIRDEPSDEQSYEEQSYEELSNELSDEKSGEKSDEKSDKKSDVISDGESDKK
eukprot:CAMPEP_0175949766 /NCGR_PEP_ID=MMETSP0108-20121206/29217_1 /TAXON_ID=195067 ORGANISM="Goniomonas pacifica, Strain CCMP1869" /NCGR_SAMPLE_ID=MMETSP0108 /ASSEMBLY_ACC=CAM_ASM_000204 /LENGTH=322 /DNA_ID=CAMNT_0017275731 /DNA_START=39 /DNA_END=1007 /DNA_ORIENTATION=-